MGENENYAVDKIRFTELDDSAAGPKIDKKLLPKLCHPMSVNRPMNLSAKK